MEDRNQAPNTFGRLLRQPAEARAAKLERGFTIVELLVSLLIVGLLAAIAALNMSTALERARVTRAIAEIRGMEKVIAKYELDHGALPATLGDIGWDTVLDPWDRPYEYVNFALAAKGKGKGSGGIPGVARKDKSLVPLNSSYDLYSRGRDGESKSPLTAKASWDDVVRAGDGAFVGLAVDF